MYTALCCYFPPFQPTQSSSQKIVSFSVPRIGTAKGLDAEIEDVWFLCAELNLGAKVRKNTEKAKHCRDLVSFFGNGGGVTWPRNLKGLGTTGGHHLDLVIVPTKKFIIKEISTDLLVDFGFPALLLKFFFWGGNCENFWCLEDETFTVSFFSWWGKGPEKLARFIRERCLKGFLGFMGIGFGHQQKPWTSSRPLKK